MRMQMLMTYQEALLVEIRFWTHTEETRNALPEEPLKAFDIMDEESEMWALHPPQQ